MAKFNLDVNIAKNYNGIRTENVEKYFQALVSNVISVGVHKEEGQNNVKKMLWNEFGTNHILKHDSVAIPDVGLKPANAINFDMGDFVPAGTDISIPARPVVRMYLYPRMMKSINWNYANSIDVEKNTKLRNPVQNAEKTQKKVGEICAVLQRQKMSTRNFAPVDTKGKDINNNSRLTQKIKGYNQPYFETGELITKVNYKIKKRGS